MDNIRIVYVEDDERLARLTAQFLRSRSIDVFHVASGAEVVAEVLSSRPDVVVLDLSLPEVDGLEVCARLRRHVDTPIVMVTARTDGAARVRGLEAGADDYVCKPFAPEELLARIRAQARRARGQVGPRPEKLEVGALTIDLGSLEVTFRGQPILVTPHELAVLRALAERPGRVLGREQLMLLVTGTAQDSFDRSIDVHISRLRQKLGDDPKRPTILKTVRGAGYLLMKVDA